MKIEFDFGYKKIIFDLTQKDFDHFGTGHKVKMIEWERPISNSAFISDEVLFSFPFYSFKCRECDYKGSDYDKHGNVKK